MKSEHDLRAGRVCPNIFAVRLDRKTATHCAGQLDLGTQIHHGRMILIYRTLL